MATQRHWIAAGLLVSGLVAPLVARSESIGTPETEIATALTSLENIGRQLSTGRQLVKSRGIGPVNIAADRAYDAGSRFFEGKEYLSAARELRLYLTLTQVPLAAKHRHALAMLGRSQEELGQDIEALRTYQNYLSATVTGRENDFDELLRVMQRLMPLATKTVGESRAKIGELLSSVTSLSMPAELAPGILAEAGKTASVVNQRERAAEWFARAEKTAQSPKLRATALYYQALIALSRGDMKTAEARLNETVNGPATKSSDDTDVRDFARLALARLAVHQKKPTKAAALYAQIPDSSPSYRDALFETIYVNMSLRRDADARNNAMTYLARYPETREAYQARLLLSYLDLRAGQVADARSGIEGANADMRQFQEVLRSRYAKRDSLSRDDVTDLVKAGGAVVPASPVIDDGMRLFASLASAQRRLEDIRGEIRNAQYTLGNASLRDLNPEWVNRAESLTRTTLAVLEIGHRVIGIERQLYASSMEPALRKRLEASESRRLRSLTRFKSRPSPVNDWATWLSLTNLNVELATRQETLRRLDAELAATRAIAAGDATRPGRDNAAVRVAELESQVDRLRKSLDRSVELVRREHIKAVAGESSQKTLRAFLTEYTAALTEEVDSLPSLRDNAPAGAPRLLAEDATRMWKRWNSVIGTLYANVTELDTDITLGVNETLATMDQQIARYESLTRKVGESTRSLERLMGQSLSLILDHYASELAKRGERHDKWMADLDWIESAAATDEKSTTRRSYELERQILQDNLDDLGQEVRR